MFMVNVLGPLVIMLNGRPVPKVPKKARALIAYLALSDGVVSRERLADLLWPYQGSDQARHSLRNCLLEISKHVGRDVVGRDFHGCWLTAQTDLQRVRDLATAGGLDHLREAAGLIRGDLLEDFRVDSEPWSEWLDCQRELTSRTLSQMLTLFSQAAGAAGLHSEAIAAAQQLVKLDNLNEGSHRHLMRSFAAAGQRGSAIGQFKRLQRVLKDELGVAPDEASRALADEISRGMAHDDPCDPPDRPAAVAPAAPPAPARLRIVEPKAVEDDKLTLLLDKLAAEIGSWQSGIARLTRSMIGECGASMALAATEIRRLQSELALAKRLGLGSSPLAPTLSAVAAESVAA